jgi:uridine kinase
MRPFVIGIGGGSASGKSTVAARVARAIGDECLLLHHDRYYHSLPEALRSNPLAYNFDHPAALDTTRLLHDLDALREGRSCRLPVYDFPRHRRAAEEEVVVARRLLVVEGILVLADPALRARFDVTFYVHAPDDVRLARRVRRDIEKRGRTVHQILDQYEATVRPMHQAYVEPSRAHADHVLDGTSDLDGLVAQVIAAIPAEAAGEAGARA